MPSSRSLLQAIKRLMKFTDIIGMNRINVPKGLKDVNFLLEHTMKEGIPYIKLS